jgi:hypothetical protein
MANGVVPFQNPGTVDGRLDTEELTVGGQSVHRERVQLAGATETAIATIREFANGKPLAVVLTDGNGDSYSASGGTTIPPATAIRTQVADSAVAVLLIASNAARKGLVITNDSSARVFVGYGAVTPTTTNYTFVIYAGQTWEMTPSNVFAGQLNGIWETDPNDGAARITELTA